MLKIFNTLTHNLEDFSPITPTEVKFYQCGPTVYSRQHIGNVYSAIKGDQIRRALNYLDYEVNFVRNITDVGHLVSDEDDGEDKMAKGASREHTSPAEIAKKYADLYHQDLQKLNVLPPTTETVATDYIQQMAQLVQELLDKGFAYATAKAIYFEVDKFPKYNELNRQNLDANLEGAGHGDVGDADKKKPYDFAIWFFKTGKHINALQTWEINFKGIEQPIISGFPGWHIECSAMSREVLGKTLDIHMGGIEHIPVHHTNEIAQSEAANGQKFVNYWIHHELIMVDGTKMSKSLGNVYSLDDVIEKGFDPLDYRYFSLQAHYRSKQNFTWEALQAAKTAREKLVKQLVDMEGSVAEVDPSYKQLFIDQLSNDFNLPGALAVVWDLLKDQNVSTAHKLGTILDFDTVLGLNLREAIADSAQDTEPHISTAAQKILDMRAVARAEKDWQRSDLLRDQLRDEFGLQVVDEESGQKVVVDK